MQRNQNSSIPKTMTLLALLQFFHMSTASLSFPLTCFIVVLQTCFIFYFLISLTLVLSLVLSLTPDSTVICSNILFPFKLVTYIFIFFNLYINHVEYSVFPQFTLCIEIYKLLFILSNLPSGLGQLDCIRLLLALVR